MSDFMRLCHPNPESSVLDVGFLAVESYEAANFFLGEYPYPRSLTAAGIEDCHELRTKYPLVEFVKYDGRRFPFADKSFAVCHSNAFVEHVGDARRQRSFVSEMMRVAGRGFFITPNRWFPVELHTEIPLLHYLPWSLFVRICRLLRREKDVRGVRCSANVRWCGSCKACLCHSASCWRIGC
jgi:SAM-dependent methyltransferase